MDELITDNRIARLIVKHLQQTITPGESAELEAWIHESESHRAYLQRISDNDRLQQDLLEYYDAKEKMLARIYAAIPETKLVVSMARSSIHIKRWSLVAASVLLMIMAGIFLWQTYNHQPATTGITKEEDHFKDIEPGQYKARLTLANGQTIVLDSAAPGELARQGSTTLVNEHGQLVYSAGSNNDTAVLYNTLSTAKGETYTTVLADRTKVWLNSGSTIKFPVIFTGNERRVEITGEAYFEVAKDAAKPFRVSIASATTSKQLGEVNVLGTSFNIMAYDNEEVIKTTLLEGRVQMTSAHAKAVRLQPGQQAILESNSQAITVQQANTDLETAWKNGFFYFDNTDLRVVLKQLERWYDVEVRFSGTIPAMYFGGEIQRNLPLSKVLDNLARSGVHFTVEGNIVTITP